MSLLTTEILPFETEGPLVRRLLLPGRLHLRVPD